MSIRVLVNGAEGKMGKEVVAAISDTPELELVGTGEKQDDLTKLITSNNAQVVVDFTHPDVAFSNAKKIINANAHPVIGTTGFSSAQIAELKKMSASKKLGGIIAPNFSISTNLMIKYAQDCARYLPHVEIIEMHHDKKVDAPSGTAIKTAEMIAHTKPKTQPKVNEQETLAGARGAVLEDIHIHAVRLPGLVAHQSIIFGGDGETFTLRHDTQHRRAFMPGVMLACQKVLTLNELVYGLEHIL